MPIDVKILDFMTISIRSPDRYVCNRRSAALQSRLTTLVGLTNQPMVMPWSHPIRYEHNSTNWQLYCSANRQYHNSAIPLFCNYTQNKLVCEKFIYYCCISFFRLTLKIINFFAIRARNLNILHRS